MNNGPKIERHVTPLGIFVYPRLNEADHKFKKEYGEYSLKLKLPANEAAPFIQMIQEATDKAYKAECLRHEKPKLKRSVYLPYANEEDDQGQPTGNVLFKFTLTGGFKSKKTGEVVTLKPLLYDRFGKVVTEAIWGGTKGKVSFTFKPYFAEAIGMGMSLNLKAVQVHELVTKGMGTAESCGFDVEDSAPMADDEVLPTEGASNGKAGDF